MIDGDGFGTLLAQQCGERLLDVAHGDAAQACDVPPVRVWPVHWRASTLLADLATLTHNTVRLGR